MQIDAGNSLERSTGIFERMERAAMELDGLKLVESVVREEGGSVTARPG